MPRQVRIIIPPEAYHVIQRGNYRQEIFEDGDDFKQYSRKCKIDILAYCLITNHVHIIGTSNDKESFAKAFNSLAMRYSQYINRKRVF